MSYIHVFYLVCYLILQRKHLPINMSLLAANYILLSALINNIFYISQPYNAQEVYVCFNKTDDTWPSAWTRMESLRDPPSFSITLPENATEYKLRIVFINRTVGDSVWKNLSTCAKNASSTKLRQQEETITGSPPHPTPEMLYYISVITSFLFLKAIISLAVHTWSASTRIQ